MAFRELGFATNVTPLRSDPNSEGYAIDMAKNFYCSFGTNLTLNCWAGCAVVVACIQAADLEYKVKIC